MDPEPQNATGEALQRRWYNKFLLYSSITGWKLKGMTKRFAQQISPRNFPSSRIGCVIVLFYA
jgi:hypothetical protein